ncbi:23S rRNA (adenine(2030)-N(6))-methyltransferase RlmJ, partial [Mesorhizobium sp. M0915]|uniref:23S rRNA (adenine(2030)-N(6))-methyltransferase RlmJ n=1 Tax=Mesorhizobium sp. M0915 TaxID=2957027 RepID=UPI003335D71B
MNYRHAYHAGNFADVVKHAVLSRLIEYLKQKDKAFRVIDTHAGIGRYDLSSTEAQKTGEWQGGRRPGGPGAPRPPPRGVVGARGEVGVKEIRAPPPAGG